MAQRLKNRYLLCSELIEMCNLIKIEIGYFSNDTGKIIKNLSEEPSLSRLKFLKTLDLENIHIKTELNETENEKINSLFKMLGSADSISTIEMVDSFKASIEESRRRYLNYSKSHSRLYIAFGIFGGIAVSIVLI